MNLQLNRPIAFFDLETTGLSVTNDRIVEICILKININGEKQIRTQRINPTIPISPEATSIHGICDADVKDMPTFKQVAGEFVNLLHNCDLAGFNSNRFDVPLLIEEFLRADVDFDFKNRRFVDVLNIFHKMEPRNLGAAFRFYCNKELTNAHSAEADTVATYEILLSQLDRYNEIEYKDKAGNVSVPVKNDVESLHKFTFDPKILDFVGFITLNEKQTETFSFGKHKGKSVEDVFKSEPSYYDWMMKSDFPLLTKKVITSIKLRGFNHNSVNIK
ncbi:MAG: 3'-5' exonuclease [Bacteroidota bacterium]